MQIHNPILTGSFSYNGADLSNITSSNATSASLSSILTSVSSSNQQVSASYIALSASYNVASSSLSTRTTQIEQVYATTGSNSFRATQSITGSLTVTGQIIAQTINVQQVTSSIVFSSGSNTFGCDLNSRQTFTGSVIMTGSLTVNTTGVEFQVNNTGVNIGNLLTDNHSITGSLRITGSITTFNSCVGIGTSPSFPFDMLVSSSGTFNTVAQIFNNDFTACNRSYLRVRQQVNSGGSASSYFGTGQDSNLYIIANNSARGGDLVINAGTGAASFVGSATFGSDVFTYNNGGIFFSGGGVYTSGIFQNSAGLNLQTCTTPRLIVQNNGNIQIDNGQLNVPKTIYFQGNSTTGCSYGDIKWYNVQWDGNTRAEIVVEGDGALANGRMVFKTGASGANAVERLRITSAGHLSFNPNSSSGAMYVIINRTTNVDGGILLTRNGNTNDWQIINDNNGNYTMYSYGIGTNAFVINRGTGNATLYGSLTQNASDQRLKNNIQIIPNAIDKINQLKGVTFEWNQELYETSRTTDIGVIAQDVQKVLPNAVTLAPFDINSDDNTSKSGNNYLTVYYEKLIPLLIEGIKELKAENDIFKTCLGIS